MTDTSADPDKKGHEFHIQIDRVHYTITQVQMTGTELRELGQPVDRARSRPLRGATW